jgi:uncharacterized membrane protein
MKSAAEPPLRKQLQYLTSPETPINWITGVARTVGAITMFVPRLRAVARWTNLGLLVPTLPTAVAQTTQSDRMRELGIPPALVIARIRPDAPRRGILENATPDPALSLPLGR